MGIPIGLDPVPVAPWGLRSHPTLLRQPKNMQESTKQCEQLPFL